MSAPRKGLCQCGCGQPAPLATRTDKRFGHVKGEPMCFIQAHANRGRRNTPPIIQIGAKYGRWTVLAEAGVTAGQKRRLYLCRCDCGTERKVIGPNLKRGASKSCGCQSLRQTDEKETK